MMMGMSMGLSLQMDQEDKPLDNTTYGNYECPVCGERHASDDTSTWCAINKIAKEKVLDNTVPKV